MAKRSERFAMRLSPTERETLRRAAERLEVGDTAELVRRSSVLTANNIIQFGAGEITLSAIVTRYITLLIDLGVITTDEAGGAIDDKTGFFLQDGKLRTFTYRSEDLRDDDDKSGDWTAPRR
jgi:hypothetical protein